MRLLKVILLLLVGLVGHAQESDCKCCTAENEQFSFWIGEWEVKDSTGKLLGTNSIQPIQGGCGLMENWTGASGVKGSSISFYNRATQQWHQSWIEANGGSIVMDGEFENGAMVLHTAPRATEQGTFQNRTTWRPVEGGKVSHIWEQTQDGGTTWKVIFDGVYSRK